MTSIVFHCVGDREHGFGHVIRDLHLAAALRARGADVRFITPDGTPGAQRLAASGFPWRSPGGWYSDGALAYNEDAYVFDLEHGPTREQLSDVRDTYPFVVNIGGIGFAQSDPAAVARLVDLHVYGGELFDPPASPNVLSGPDYLIIDPRYTECRPDYAHGHIVVALGGADPHHLTGPVLDALAGAGRPVWCVVGPAADPPMRRPGNIITWNAPPSLTRILHGAALTITATGMTAYESLAAGVPVLLTNWSTDHLRTARELEMRECGYNLGLWSEFDGARLRRRADKLLADPARLIRMGGRGRALVDGQGAARVADEFLARIQLRAERSSAC